MKRTARAVIAAAAALAVLAGCQLFTESTDRVRSAIEHYCENTTEAQRALLRSELATEKGPIVVVHCENL